MLTAFHKELTDYIRAKDKESANEVILRELALCLATDKENFIDVLRNAGIDADSNESDLNLIELFVNNAPKNRKLLLGAALLVNHRNKVTNFDGDEEISDAGVKNTYNCLRSNFIGKEYSNIGGWGDAVKSVAELGSKFQQSGRAKKYGASDSLAAQQEARRGMIGALLEQRKQEAGGSIDKEASAKKSKNTLFIVGGVVATVAIIGLLIYKFKK
jgi:hypothetical protein